MSVAISWAKCDNSVGFPKSSHIYVLVISQYKNDIVITRDRGGAEVECNNNDIIRVNRIYLAYIPYKIEIGNNIITSYLNKCVDDNYCSVN